MKIVRGWVFALVLAALVSGIAIYGGLVVRNGFSARTRPSAAETFLARHLRRWGTPSRALDLKSPMPQDEETVGHGRNHWADHCATCHANNGSGDTEIGRSLYPPVPDMRKAETQSLSDGELYYIIRNGVRLTGMPAWGNPADVDTDHETWALVAFIRHLPQITSQEENAMKEVNPKTAAERQEEQEENDFLNGKTTKEISHEDSHKVH
jgi:mono/diheme cytochrome c family protein